MTLRSHICDWGWVEKLSPTQHATRGACGRLPSQDNPAHSRMEQRLLNSDPE
eukprot:CAMPEP_0196652158 /NCGR_PEP_ID=MMETSP1086-20130531/1374_1 /TAXON_ID=77921 /ORGANISM="Cyanoptyche  gloeocystis , Strain SAG4.97" /LENGTH=51 /DNA_ID=CAMNT_0041982545 /DNA_START=168 /DNA_END=320 /DNA_ORIENTATION=-